MSEPPPPHEGDDDEARRKRANLAAAIAALLIAAGTIWLMKTLQDHQRIENCLASGRRDCLAPIAQPAAPGASP